MYFMYFVYLNSCPTWWSLNCHWNFCVDHLSLGVTILKECGYSKVLVRTAESAALLPCGADQYLVNVPGVEDCDGKISKVKRWRTWPAMRPAKVEPPDAKLVAKAPSSWVWFLPSWSRTKTFKGWCRWSGRRRRRRRCWWRRWRWRWGRWPSNLQWKTGALDLKSDLCLLSIKTEQMKLARLYAAPKIDNQPINAK